MQYKAIVFDLDGTAIPNKREGMPSQHLVGLIHELKDRVFVSVATARPLSICRHILKDLKLTSPCVISGGAQIIDPVTEQVLWEKLIPIEIVEQVVGIAKQFDFKLFVSNENNPSLALLRAEEAVKKPEHIIYIMTADQLGTDILLDKLKKITNIISHAVPSYIDGYFDIHITHSEATKKHALDLLLEMLKVKKEEVIGFGDGDNDLPIFEAVGYKVAMSNASQELKNLADLIAPSAEDDGVARVLENLVA